MENMKKQAATEIIDKALQKQYPTMRAENRKTVVREMVFAPENRMIEIDDKRKMGAKDMSFMTAHTLEIPLEGGLIEKYAKSIELINSEIDPIAEYFSWLGETTSILKHLNDGFITKEDAAEREAFLDFTDQREADLMVCLGLYERCKSKEADERIKFVRYKLQRLREMRTAIKFLTRTGQDVETTKSEYDAAIPYYKYFKNLQRLPFGYDMPREQKDKLGISHEDDEDLAEDYKHHDDIINEMLDEMRARDEMKMPENKKVIQNSEEDELFTGR